VTDLMPEVRYTCPFPTCPWTYTEPPIGPIRLAPGETIPEGIGAAVSRASAELRKAVDAALEDHLNTHPLREWLELVQQLRQALGTARPDHPLLRATSPANTFATHGRSYL
jgi:hypothetical protein